MNGSTATRRRFLRLAMTVSGTTALGLFTVGCMPAQPAATPTPAPAKPTAAPAAPAASAPTSAPAESKPAAPAAPPAATTAPPPTTAPAVSQPVAITYWYWADSPAIGEFFRATVDEFNNKQKAVRVEAEAQTAFQPAREKLVATAAAGGGGPDATYGNMQMAFEFNQAGFSRPIQDLFDKWPRKDDLFPSALETHRSIGADKQLIYMPWGIQADYHYYRADAYQEVGLKAPDTFEDIVKYARALTKAPDRYGFGLRAADGVGFQINVLNYVSNDGITYTDGKGGSDLDSPAAAQTIQTIADLYYEGVAQPSALQDRFPQMVALFQSGKLAQWSASVNHSVLLAGANGEFEDKIGISPFPTGKSGKRWVQTASVGNLMMKSSKNVEATWQWIMALMEPDVVERFCKVLAFVPPLKSVADRPSITSNRYFKLSIDMQPNWGSYPVWHKNWNSMQLEQGPQLWQQVLQKQLTVPDMLKKLADLMRQV